MYQQTTEQIDDLSFIKFYNPETDNGFSVMPDFGACLLDLQIKGKKLLDAYQSADEVRSNFYFKNTILAPFPNRLRDGQYTCNGKQYQFPINDEDCHTALHGMVYNQNFEIKAVNLGKECELILAHHYDGNRASYPFPFLLTIIYRQTKDEFTVEMSCENLHQHSIPMELGWHPYFQLGTSVNDLYLELPKVKKVLIDKQMIPTGVLENYQVFSPKNKIGEHNLDNAFFIEEKDREEMKVVLSSSNGQLHYLQKLESNQANYVQIFTPPSRQSIAIEPMTCNIDAFNEEGHAMLAPNEKKGLKCSLIYLSILQ